MATTPQLTFVPGRRSGNENVILDGYRFTPERTRNEKTYIDVSSTNKDVKLGSP